MLQEWLGRSCGIWRPSSDTLWGNSAKLFTRVQNKVDTILVQFDSISVVIQTFLC